MSVPAFKEWAVIVRALLSGEQILDVRKGGLREDGRHFAVRTPRCWLYPTVEHQREDLLKPAYRRWIGETEAAAPPPDEVRIDGWAEIVAATTVTDPAELARLDSKLIWTLDYASSRLSWKRRDPLWVLALRSYRLSEPLVVAFEPEYRGCTSWVDVHGLPDDPSSLPAEPALSDESFAARRKLLEQQLGRALEPVDAGAGISLR
jgi:hypothetical protein